jgi:hypothetical protein
MTITRRRPALIAGVLAGLIAQGAAESANLTPPNLGAASSLADQDLFVVWPNASGGPLEQMQWSTLRAQIASGLASSWLLPANNLSDLTNISAARANLGLGTAASANTGTSGATLPFLNTANTWSAQQLFTRSAAGTSTVPAVVQNSAAYAAGATAQIQLQPSPTHDVRIEASALNANSTGLNFYVENAGGLIEPMLINNLGQFRLTQYNAGLLQTDAAGNVTSTGVYPAALTVSVVNNANGLIITNSTYAKSWTIYPFTSNGGADTDLGFYYLGGAGPAGLMARMAGADGSATFYGPVTLQAASLTRPTMPAFSAKLSAALSNVTGNTVTYSVPFNTLIFDRHGDFNTSTGAFTVPFTGIYECSARLTLTGVASDNSRFQLQMHGAGAGSNDYVIDAGKLTADANGRVGLTLTDLVSLVSGNTLVVRLEVEGHASSNIGILNDAGSGSAAPSSTFSCSMVG